jgi:hypothetical protein
MKKWCKSCQGAYPEKEGGIVYGEAGESLYWICSTCVRRAKVSGDRRVRALADVLDEGGSQAVDAALHALSGSSQAKA